MKCHKIYSLIYTNFLLIFFSTSIYSQYVLSDKPFLEPVSLHNQTTIADVGKNQLTIQYVMNHFESLKPKKLIKPITNLGFTNNNFWAKTELKNPTNVELKYYLESAGPKLYLAELFTINKATNKITKTISGFSIPYSERSFNNRKTFFKIIIPPHSTIKLFLHLKNDGDVIKMQMILHNTDTLVSMNLKEQFLFGIFYGIIVTAAIIYLFFYFALGEKVILFYCLYLIFTGLMQLAMDGFLYQMFTPDDNWITNHAVLFFALIAIFSLGKYVETFLNIKKDRKKVYYSFNIIYCLVSILIALILFVPSLLIYRYQFVNILGLLMLFLITLTLIHLHYHKKHADHYFCTGIAFLILGFVFFILNNFGHVSDSFLVRHSPKFGTALEIIFLSVSMANLIHKLKDDKCELNKITLRRSQEINELKSYFLSNISHELRTPLNAIMNLIKSISNDTNDIKIKKDCEIIKNSSFSLLNSINDILDYSKIEKGELVLEEVTFDPEKVINQIKDNACIQANEQNLNFEYSKSGNIPQLCIGDVNRFRQIINNVLTNALKFTKEGKVKFHLNTLYKTNNEITLIITISDTGVGIPKDKIDQIYDSFSQNITNTKRKFGGLGLGLYIVKNLVDLQRGTIDLHSEVGTGTSCTISLDFIVADVPKNEIITKEEDFDLKGKKILVVEDNAINQMVIKMITKKWQNTSVSFANNGQEGLNALKNNNFDIILMDLQMPVMDGYETTIAIRNGEVGSSNSNIPIIAVTADVMESTKKRVKEIGMNDYLSKPLKNRTLYKAIENLT